LQSYGRLAIIILLQVKTVRLFQISNLLQWKIVEIQPNSNPKDNAGRQLHQDNPESGLRVNKIISPRVHTNERAKILKVQPHGKNVSPSGLLLYILPNLIIPHRWQQHSQHRQGPQEVPILEPHENDQRGQNMLAPQTKHAGIFEQALLLSTWNLDTHEGHYQSRGGQYYTGS